jgi:hypothetical protein
VRKRPVQVEGRPHGACRTEQVPPNHEGRFGEKGELSMAVLASGNCRSRKAMSDAALPG